MWKWLMERFWGLTFLNREIIVFEARGCMAHDWRELYRGKIVAVVWRTVYGGRPQKYKFYRVKLADGSLVEIPAMHVLPVREEMQARTDNPDESLVGKLVLVK